MSYAQEHRSASDISQRASVHALLNCIIKEVAIPERRLAFQWPSHRLGLPEALAGVPLLIEWSTSLHLWVMVDRQSTIGSQYYLSDVYLKAKGDSEWTAAGAETLISRLLKHLPCVDAGINQELAQQVRQSRQVMAEIVRHAAKQPHRQPLADYPSSEQGLWFGHPNHPTPKARQWPDECLDDGTPSYAPECGIATSLYQFSFPADGLRVQANRVEEEDVLSYVADQAAAESDERVVLSMHPVQAAMFKQAPAVKALLQRNVIRDLGQSGFSAVPTASMRTWYIEGHPWFIKGSLNVRITNCVRKNAWYELESTLVIDRIMHQLGRLEDPSLATLLVAEEPATVHWTPNEGNEEEQRWFREQTGIILRENFCRRFSPQDCLLTGTLFARDTTLVPMVLSFISQGYEGSRSTSTLPEQNQVRAWFRAYLRTLLAPVLGLFFRHGIVMEPHLQNCVLIHEAGTPQKMLLRDFEGVKLTRDKGTAWLAGEVLHPRVEASMIYSREQGWNRIAYCLFVNQIAEAILALSWQRPALADALWQDTSTALQRVRNKLEVAAPELDALLQGGALPCKTNFKLRLMAQADRQAHYVSLPNPWHVPRVMGREVAYG
ncbi:IucA/IucC family protein [Halomonas meridiana]|uniref:IucA/IucC family protein n=1 Tax=Vreelandella aquamarina TaxID=77097 RepID=UPI00273AE666|nr:IucA/IucC family protein [Halomonas meridiana]MDP4556779.1 IucA/IucC family protein [Halomonas meridiana]